MGSDSSGDDESVLKLNGDEGCTTCTLFAAEYCGELYLIFKIRKKIPVALVLSG